MFNFEERLKKLFFNCANLLLVCTQSGFIGVKNKFEEYSSNDVIYDYLKVGVQAIVNGKPPELLSMIMRCEEMKWIRDINKTSDDLILIIIIQQILHYMHVGDIDGFLNLVHEYYPREEYSEIYYLFSDKDTTIE